MRVGVVGCAVLLAAGALVAGCDDDDTTPAASPVASVTSVLTPQPIGWETPPATADPRLDQIIRYALAGDWESLHAFMRTVLAPCMSTPIIGGGPICGEDEAEGTLVTAFNVAGPCEGALARAEGLNVLPPEKFKLFAVTVGSGGQPERVRIVFEYSGRDAGFYFDYVDGLIASRHGTCGPASRVLEETLSFIIAPIGLNITPIARTPTPLPVVESDIAVVDEFVVAVVAADREKVVRMMEFAQEPCVLIQQVGSPPGCPAGVAEGTPIDAFLVVGCDGGPLPRAEAEASVRRQVDESAFQLYSVSRPGTPLEGETHLVTLLSNNRSAEILMEFHFSQTGLIAMTGASCGTPPLLITPEPGTEYIIPPPQDRN